MYMAIHDKESATVLASIPYVFACCKLYLNANALGLQFAVEVHVHVHNLEARRTTAFLSVLVGQTPLLVLTAHLWHSTAHVQ